VAPVASEGPRRRIIASKPSSSPATSKEILIVASKLKAYVKERADMNTSASVMDVLSDKVRRLCDDAIDEARAQGRKTVLDRDFR
jgi:histone H3/H4